MTITATPYGYFFQALGMGYHSFNNDHYWCALISSFYTPDFDNDQNYFAINYMELPDGSNFDPPGDDPYTTNGSRISALNWAYDATSKASILTGNSVTWATLNGTFRYAVVYRWNGTDSDGPLVGCLDYGSDQVFTGGPLTVDFSAGIVSLAAA